MRVVKIVTLFFFVSSMLHAANYGRWGAVDQYTDALVISGASNTIRRLALFDGLTFLDSATRAIYSSVLPISGDVNLNGGRLRLDRELRFGDLVDFVGEGDMRGISVVHDVYFPSTLTSWSSTYSFRRVNLQFNNDLELNTDFTFELTCTLDANGHRIDLRNGGEIFVTSGSDLTLKDVVLLGVKDENLRCSASDAMIYLNNCTLVLSGTYDFTQGSIDIYQDASISGTGAFAFTSQQDFKIHSKSKLLIDHGVTFSYDSDAASKEKIIFEDDTSILYLNGCTLHSTRTGIRLSTGTVFVQDLVTVKNEATVIGEAMEFSPDLTVNILGGSTFDFVEGLVIYE